MTATERTKRKTRRPAAPKIKRSIKGDAARAMFANWKKNHADTNPITWNELKSTLAKN